MGWDLPKEGGNYQEGMLSKPYKLATFKGKDLELTHTVRPNEMGRYQIIHKVITNSLNHIPKDL